MTAMLLAMAALPTVMEVVLFTAVFGNVNMERSLTNILTMFNVLSLEMDWREKQGMPLGFEAFRAFKPLVSAGSNHALGKPFVNQTDGYRESISACYIATMPLDVFKRFMFVLDSNFGRKKMAQMACRTFRR